MKNKVTIPHKIIRMPELEIHGVWGKIINRMSHIRLLYWILIIIVSLTIFIILMPNYMRIYLWSSLKVQGVLVSMLLIFSLVAVSLVWSTGQRIDVWVLLCFNMRGKRAPWLDWTMLGITQIGNSVFAMVVAFILFLAVNHVLAYELVLGTLTLWLVVELLKVIFNRTRPYIKLDNIRIVGSRASGHSFPSGHTSQAFFIMTLMIHYFRTDIFVALVLYAIALLVGITRIYVGMHYPRDVLAGSILGTSWGLLGVIANSFIWKIG